MSHKPEDAVGEGDSSSRYLLWTSAAAVAGLFILRLPGIVEPMGPDQGVFAAVGRGLQRGLALYRDLWEQKPPGIHLTYQLGFVLFGNRPSSIFWLDYFAGVLTTVVLFDLGRRAVNRRFGALLAVVFAIGTLPAARFGLGGFVERAVAETFISLFAAAAAWAAVVRLTGQSHWFSFGAGLCTGIAVVFKPTALIYWPALVVWVWLVSDAVRARQFAVRSMAGVAVAPLLTIAWLSAHGVLADAWIAIGEYNQAYLATGNTGLLGLADQFAREVWRRVKTDEVWLIGSVAAAVAVGAWPWRSIREDWMASLGVVWLGAALIAAAANGVRPFNTYFVPSLLPLCLLTAWAIDRTLLAAHRQRTVLGVVLLLVIGLMVWRSGSAIRAINTTRWNLQHWTGQIDRDEYLQRYRSRDGRAFSAPDNARLADYVRAHTGPDERIYVFGMTAGTYFLSDRLPASRFVWVYPAVSNLLARPEFRLEGLAADLARAAPRYIILQRHNRDSLTGWRVEDSFEAAPMAAVLREYRPETEIGNFVLYRRKTDRAAAVASVD